jgi:hypothetical protein
VVSAVPSAYLFNPAGAGITKPLPNRFQLNKGYIMQGSLQITKSSFFTRHSGAVVAFLGLAILANAFAAYFVTQERYVYFWDYSGYWLWYLDISALLPEHPLLALRRVLGSVWYGDYSLLPVLPLLPFEWLFGNSRLTYILAITNFFILPAAFLIAFLAQRTSSLKRSISLLVPVTAIILTLHSLWSPVLRGLPDAVGLVVIGAILLFHFARPFAEQRWSYLFTTGLLLCLLMLLRRWYAYWVVAFFPALALAQSLDIYQRHGLAWRQYLVAARKAAVIGLTFLISLFGLAPPFALRAITTDYSDIYSAFRNSNSLLETAVSLSLYFGWLVFFGGLIGLSWLAARKETRVIAAFLLVQSIITFVLFARTQDFGYQHYYLLFPAIALGIAAVIINLSAQITNGLWRTASVGLLFAVLLACLSTVFAPRAASLSNILGDIAPNVRIYPLVRNDFDMLNHLLDRLDELEMQQHGDIYVLASSTVLNSSILQNHCRHGQRPWTFCDSILTTNDVDKRDGFPRQFLHASYLIVANPTQYHLRANDQRVVGITVRAVTEGTGIGASFQRLSGEFKLDQGVTAWVYEKIRPFERADLEALADEFAKYYPDKRNIFSVVDEWRH